MHKNIIKIPIKNMRHDEWLAERRNHIGGSDAAAIVGMSKWSSPVSVWADKLGKIPPKEDNEAMRQGRDLEQYVAERFMEETGKKVRRENAILVNPAYPFAHANVDRLIVGEDAGLECKTTSVLNLKTYKNGEYPDNYYVQCVHYMAVTGAKRWYLAVLVLGVGFYVFVIERDEDEINALMNAEKEFWQYVANDEMPPVDGTDPTSDTLERIYPESNGETVDMTAFGAKLDTYQKLGERIDELKKDREGIANEIKAYMGEAEKGEAEAFRVSYKSSERRTFDSKRFAADHPDMELSEYYNVSNSRTFRITTIKKKENA